MKNQGQNKNRNREKSGQYVRNIIAAIAVINLILLFVFDYRVPVISGLITRLEDKRGGETYEITSADMESEVSQEKELQIEFEEETLKYNGDGALDLLEGVTVVDSKGNIYSNGNVTASIVKKGAKKQKTVSYVYSDEDGRTAEAERKLTLIDYDGPSITLADDIPEVQDDALDHLKQEYGKAFTAQDGYGKDITSEVKITANVNKDYNGNFVLTFQVKNAYGDTAKEEVEVGIAFQRAHLSLQASDISLKKGEEFKAADYIKYAVDAEGKDISDQIKISGQVDTDKLGDYKVTYELDGTQGEGVKEKVLTVHVAEN